MSSMEEISKRKLKMTEKPIEWNKDYLEWCEIMNQKINVRDQIIFMAGYTFALIDIRDEPEESI